MWKFPVIAIFILVWLCACVSDPQRGQDHMRSMTLIYSGNLDGELEPCGCSEEGDLGGIKRRVNKIDQLREQAPDLFLISAGGLLISDMQQDRLTSEYILKGYAALDYDAIGVQWRDLAFGEKFLKHDKLPFVASNWQDDTFKDNRVIKHDGYTLAFFQWLDPQSDPHRQMLGHHSTVSDDTGALAERIRKSKLIGATTVLSSTLSLEDAKQTLPLENVDILIIESSYEVYGDPMQFGNVLILQPGSRGMRLGRLDLEVADDGSIVNWQHEVIPLPTTVGDAPRMDKWYAEYNDKVKAAYEKSVALRKATESGESPFAGEAVCQACHVNEHAIWSESKHASAFYQLQDVNKAFDPNCIVCHTVGFDVTGGFIDPDTTPQFMHVQCESCHGSAREHAESGGVKPVANAAWSKEKMCAQCHTQPHSPSFSVESYWPKITHGK